MSRIYDCSPPITQSLAVWPGDTPPSRNVLLDMTRGDNLTLSSLNATVHLGSHVDGANHYGVNSPGVDEWDVERFWGPCVVLDVDVGPDRRVKLESVPTELPAERVLLKTGSFQDVENFNEHFAGLSPDIIHRLADRGVRLVGVDTPSVDLFESKALETHNACLERDVAILEGLVLKNVPVGRYEISAVPLRLVGFDASPVRAVLRSLD